MSKLKKAETEQLLDLLLVLLTRAVALSLVVTLQPEHYPGLQPMAHNLRRDVDRILEWLKEYRPAEYDEMMNLIDPTLKEVIR